MFLSSINSSSKSSMIKICCLLKSKRLKKTSVHVFYLQFMTNKKMKKENKRGSKPNANMSTFLLPIKSSSLVEMVGKDFLGDFSRVCLLFQQLCTTWMRCMKIENSFTSLTITCFIMTLTPRTIILNSLYF